MRVRSYSQNNPNANCIEVALPQGTIFFSYRTPIAFLGPQGLVVRQNDWGPTTGKHLNWLDDGNKAARIPGDEFEKKLNELFGGVRPETVKDLLEACEKLVEWDQSNDDPELISEACSLARAVIAKAKGEIK